MKQQFAVTEELQELLSALPSTAVGNVVWNAQPSVNTETLPLDPNSVRRMLAYSKGLVSEEATPTTEYNCWVKSLDGGTADVQVSFTRGE